jgi:hypothetical protein
MYRVTEFPAPILFVILEEDLRLPFPDAESGGEFV